MVCGRGSNSPVQRGCGRLGGRRGQPTRQKRVRIPPTQGFRLAGGALSFFRRGLGTAQGDGKKGQGQPSAGGLVEGDPEAVLCGGEALALRLDLFLSKSRLLKSRSVAKQACQGGRVSVGEQSAKASKEVSEGDLLTLSFLNRTVEVEIVKLPWKNMKKSEAANTYRILSEQISPLSLP
ncbi:MAG: RNA-binding S4 domain-containing protein [Candidatus Zixiibacteriota bacterium]|nr:MAG: RNA-binding S4 domain-containing protein [candidate division Zixibacteria bacterium]